MPTPTPPNAEAIDFGTTPVRTKKAITLKVSTPVTEVREQSLEGNTFKFTQQVVVDVYVRDAKAPGLRLGREPADLVKLEKYLVDYFAINRLAFRDQGVQYMEVVGTQTFPEIIGGEENRQVWYRLSVHCRAHYWLRATEE